MLAETKKALRVTDPEYDSELASLLEAGAGDLKLAGVILPGEVSFEVDDQTGEITDTSTITDALVKRALITYAGCRFGNPPNYDRLKASYDEQKAQLMRATGYTDFGPGPEPGPEPEPEPDPEPDPGDGEGEGGGDGTGEGEGGDSP